MTSEERISVLERALSEANTKTEALELRIYDLEQILEGFKSTISEHLS